MASKNFSQIVKQARIKAGLTQKQVYEHFDIPQSTFSSWEVGKSEPSGEMLIHLCEFYKCDLMKEFSGTTPSIMTVSDIELVKKYHCLDPHGKDMVDTVLEKEYSRSIAIKEAPPQEEISLIDFPVSPYKASAGSGYLLFDEEPDEIWGVISNNETRKADIGITVSGDSMEPLYYDGDILLVRKQPDINIGEIGIFIKDGQGYVKKKGKNRLISLNKARADIFPSEYGEITCFGKVIGKMEPEWVIEK